jgi:hypothetical protein
VTGINLSETKCISICWPVVAAILGVLVSLNVPTGGQIHPAPAVNSFAEKDALQVMDGLRKALESESRSHLLAMFDSKRMPGFAVFRDQVTQFFEQYQSFQVRYHVSQVAQDGEFGSIVTEFFVQALPATDGLPGLRRRVQMHLVVARDSGVWKITDLSPRSIFQ